MKSILKKIQNTKNTHTIRVPINKQNIHPSIYQKKVTNVNEDYFKETECLMMIKP